MACIRTHSVESFGLFYFFQANIFEFFQSVIFFLQKWLCFRPVLCFCIYNCKFVQSVLNCCVNLFNVYPLKCWVIVLCLRSAIVTCSSLISSLNSVIHLIELFLFHNFSIICLLILVLCVSCRTQFFSYSLWFLLVLRVFLYRLNCLIRWQSQNSN